MSSLTRSIQKRMIYERDGRSRDKKVQGPRSTKKSLKTQEEIADLVNKGTNKIFKLIKKGK